MQKLQENTGLPPEDQEVQSYEERKQRSMEELLEKLKRKRRVTPPPTPEDERAAVERWQRYQETLSLRNEQRAALYEEIKQKHLSERPVWGEVLQAALGAVCRAAYEEDPGWRREKVLALVEDMRRLVTLVAESGEDDVKADKAVLIQALTSLLLHGALPKRPERNRPTQQPNQKSDGKA